LAADARQTVLAEYTLDGMVDLIEEYLNAVFDNYLQKNQLTMAKSFRERAANSA
jgi:hypothetical protein